MLINNFRSINQVTQLEHLIVKLNMSCQQISWLSEHEMLKLSVKQFNESSKSERLNLSAWLWLP
uniref:Uncharacterized protein n=1 Tax=Tetranychus urticae TaxID=32264 RepID=T1K5Z5_TETUR